MTGDALLGPQDHVDTPAVEAAEAAEAAPAAEEAAPPAEESAPARAEIPVEEPPAMPDVLPEAAPAAEEALPPAEAIPAVEGEAAPSAADLEAQAVVLPPAPAEGAAPAAEPVQAEVARGAAPDPEIALDSVTILARPGGAVLHAEPAASSAGVGQLAEGQQRPASGLVFGPDAAWLHVPWQRQDGGDAAWAPADQTDFPRLRDYNQVAAQWDESGAMLDFRRALVRDLLRVRRADAAQIEQVNALRGEALRALEDELTRQTMLPRYLEFWQMQASLGLPDPFEQLPVQPQPPAAMTQTDVKGFGPTTFAFENWDVFYAETRGLHSGIDFGVPEGSPLIAVADGVIVDFRFLGDFGDRSLGLRPYLPGGSRQLSNVIVAYGHLTGDPTSALVHVGDEVRAGEIIGTSGWPAYTRSDGSVGVQANNAHLHLETHLVTDGQQRFGSRTPFNPLLFWSPRLIAWQARLAAQGAEPPYPAGGQPYGKLGLFSLGAFSYDPPQPIFWDYTPTRAAPWPPGVYSLDALIGWLKTFAPYAPDRAESGT